MKQTIMLLSVLTLLASNMQGQVLKRLGDRAKQKLENKAGEKIEKGIDDKVDGKKKSKSSTSNDEEEVVSSESEDTGSSESTVTTKPKEDAALKSYARYDFVPGTRILFEDNLINETDGEFPSLFNTTKGQVQVAEVNGVKMIQSFGCSDIIPRIKGSEDGKDVLPETFTIEFDAHFPKVYQEDWWWVNLRFFDLSDPKHHEYRKDVPEDMWIDQKKADYLDFTSEVPDELVHGGWNHIAIAVNKNMLKVYVNQSRTINTPNFKGNPRNFTLEFTPNGCHSRGVVAIKNLRIAEGGMDLYKRTTVDGSFIARGINFDYNKASIKPESMGEINRIVKFLNDNKEMNFEIGGHTDTDGDDTYNQKLSQQRAEAVKKQLVSMGIEDSRLTAKGFGEANPISDNTSPEGKANNRRVEFKKV